MAIIVYLNFTPRSSVARRNPKTLQIGTWRINGGERDSDQTERINGRNLEEDNQQK